MRIVMGADIAAALGRPLHGESLPIRRPADLLACGEGDLAWVVSYTPERLAAVEAGRPSLVICDAETAERTTRPHLRSDKPRLDFIRAVEQFFAPKEPPPEVHPTALIAPGAVLGRRVGVGAYARIGPQVTIGDDCLLGSGVSLEGEVHLGNRCRIKANSVIGAPGFGFEYDEAGRPIHFPHLGNVVIEDDVWIGACSTVERAGLATTRICRGAKVDDLVQIGHNVTVGANTIVTAHVVICGRAQVEENCWLAPNCVVKEGVRIGRGAKVGLGAVVLRDVAPGLVVAGVPAKPLERKT